MLSPETYLMALVGVIYLLRIAAAARARLWPCHKTLVATFFEVLGTQCGNHPKNQKAAASFRSSCYTSQTVPWPITLSFLSELLPVFCTCSSSSHDIAHIEAVFLKAGYPQSSLLENLNLLELWKLFPSWPVSLENSPEEPNRGSDAV